MNKLIHEQCFYKLCFTRKKQNKYKLYSFTPFQSAGFSSGQFYVFKSPDFFFFFVLKLLEEIFFPCLY